MKKLKDIANINKISIHELMTLKGGMCQDQEYQCGSSSCKDLSCTSTACSIYSCTSGSCNGYTCKSGACTTLMDKNPN